MILLDNNFLRCAIADCENGQHSKKVPVDIKIAFLDMELSLRKMLIKVIEHDLKPEDFNNWFM